MGVESDKCKEGCSWAWGSFLTAVFEYDTAKIVHIKNKKVGLMNRVVQLGIVGYIIGYVTCERSAQKTSFVCAGCSSDLCAALHPIQIWNYLSEGVPENWQCGRHCDY